MKTMTSRKRISSLRGSAFRKATFDGDSIHIREIPTMTKLRQGRKPKST